MKKQKQFHEMADVSKFLLINNLLIINGLNLVFCQNSFIAPL